MSEIRTLSAHADTIYSLIQRQAGSLSKAIVECVMNSIDAFATAVEIKLTSRRLEVIDNGIGFKSKDQITAWFEELGFFHEEGNHRTFGKFGVGRAQLWAYGDSRWTTNEFAMYVDVKNNGLDYELEEHLDIVHKGVKIESSLYQELSPRVLQQTLGELERLLAYVAIPVHLNGRVISRDPARMRDWTYESERLWIRVGKDLSASGALTAVYNQGVKVQDMWLPEIPESLVISKPGFQFVQDMSRNSVDTSKCPIWAEALEVLNRHRVKAKRSSASSKRSTADRKAVQAGFEEAVQAFEKDQDLDALEKLATSKQPVIFYVSGPSQRLEVFLSRQSWRGRGDIYVLGDKDDQRAVALHTAGVFRVLDRSRTDVELLAKVQRTCRKLGREQLYKLRCGYGLAAFAQRDQDFRDLPDVQSLPPYSWPVQYESVAKLPESLSRLVYGLGKELNQLARQHRPIVVADAADADVWCSPEQIFVTKGLLESMCSSPAAAASGAAKVLQLALVRVNSRDLPLGAPELELIEEIWARRHFGASIENVAWLARAHGSDQPLKHSAKALRALLKPAPVCKVAPGEQLQLLLAA